MVDIAPPKPPQPPSVNLDDSANRIRFRIWQIVMTLITVVVTGWFVTLGAIPAIMAILVAKHILVAILAAGLNLPPVPNANDS